MEKSILTSLLTTENVKMSLYYVRQDNLNALKKVHEHCWQDTS